MLNKKNIIPVLGVIVLSLALTVGLAFWLGPDSAPNAEDQLEFAKDELPGPLSPKELTAYNVDMTNKNNPVAVMTTNRGVIELELFEDTMPITAGNFIKLAEEGFYKDVKFHRVISSFMIQAGDPLTKTDEFLRWGTGGPGYTIPDEHVSGKYLTNTRGTIAMANRGPESGGSQFFINLVDNTSLDFDKQPLSSKHPVFGRVLKGMDVVDAIGTTETNDNDIPLEPVIIESITIQRP